MLCLHVNDLLPWRDSRLQIIFSHSYLSFQIQTLISAASSDYSPRIGFLLVLCSPNRIPNKFAFYQKDFCLCSLNNSYNLIKTFNQKSNITTKESLVPRAEANISSLVGSIQPTTNPNDFRGSQGT